MLKKGYCQMEPYDAVSCMPRAIECILAWHTTALGERRMLAILDLWSASMATSEVRPAVVAF